MPRPLLAQDGHGMPDDDDRDALRRGLTDQGSRQDSPLFPGNASVTQDSPRRFTSGEVPADLHRRIASAASGSPMHARNASDPSRGTPDAGASDGQGPECDDEGDGPPPDDIFQAQLLFSA